MTVDFAVTSGHVIGCNRGIAVHTIAAYAIRLANGEGNRVVVAVEGACERLGLVGAIEPEATDARA